MISKNNQGVAQYIYTILTNSTSSVLIAIRGFADSEVGKIVEIDEE